MGHSLINRPGNFEHFSSVNSLEHRAIPDPFLDPKLVTDSTVEDEQQQERQKEKDDEDEGGVDSLVHGAAPLLQAADVLFFIQEVIFNLYSKNETQKSAPKEQNAATMTSQRPLTQPPMDFGNLNQLL